MEKLFGIGMNSIALCLGSTLGAVLLGIALVAWRERVMLKLGLRPIPRRPAQSAIIVIGLMLATLIITAAFVTGDTLSHTLRALMIEGLGEIDETIRPGGGRSSYGGSSSRQSYFPFSRYEGLAAELAGYELIDHIVPAIRESVPVVNVTRQRSLRGVQLVALRPEDVGVLDREELADERGNTLPLSELGSYEVYLNAAAAEALEAVPGDRIKLYAETKPTTFIVRAVAATGDDPQLYVHLKRAQSLFDQPGKINVILISNVGDAVRGADVGPQVTGHLRGLLTDPVVAGELFGLLAQDDSAAAALRAATLTLQGNTQKDLLALAAGLQAGELTPEIRSLLADEGLAARAQSILADADWRSESARRQLESLFADLSELGVDDTKRDALDQGELAANAFTTIFVIVGLFGIAAGMMLIFLIFVMLAAERKSEMGMTRAVGAQRSHLVEMFVFEGAAYDLAAAAVGVALGVATGFVVAATLGQAFASQDITIRPYVSFRSLVVSYSLGMLVTFATVLFSSYRVSKLNIVAAIRDLPEPPPHSVALRDRLLAPFERVREGWRELRRGRILRGLWTWLTGIPLGILRTIWAGFTGGPLTLLLGLIMTPAGLRNSSAAAYTTGVSLVIIGGGLTLRGWLGWSLRQRPGLGDRIAFTLMGALLTAFWALPFDAFEKSLGIKDLKSGPEMFFISGALLVAGAVMVVMYNADLLLRLILDRARGLPQRTSPILRMAIAYPLANRFRTGLTVGMFAIVVFSVVFMAASFKTNELYFENTDALTGGFDLRAETGRANPVPSLADAVADNPRLRQSDYEVLASKSSLSVELRQGEGRWESYAVNGLDAAYLDNAGFEMAVKAAGYETSADVWRAVRDHPGYAVVDSYAVPSRTTTSIIIGGPTFKLNGVYLEDETMPPLEVHVRDPLTKATFDVTVIGVVENNFFLGFGVYTSQATLDNALPYALTPTTHYVRLAEGVDPEEASRALGTAFVKNGLQSIVQAQEIKDQQKTQRAIEILLQGFLTLGLVVGVAALGVISTRAVVERRQQIGMLRALGFQPEMVAWSFVIESSFVAFLGIGLGVVLGVIPAYHYITSMAKEIPGIRFQMPWESIALVVGLAYGMALLTTWLPAVQASRVAPAEALRYE